MADLSGEFVFKQIHEEINIANEANQCCIMEQRKVIPVHRRFQTIGSAIHFQNPFPLRASGTISNGWAVQLVNIGRKHLYLMNSSYCFVGEKKDILFVCSIKLKLTIQNWNVFSAAMELKLRDVSSDRKQVTNPLQVA